MATRYRHDYRDFEPPPPASTHPQFNETTSVIDQITSLQNEILPVFDRLDSPGADYQLLVPALRLAIRFIDTDTLLGFWHAVFFGEVRTVVDDYHSKMHPKAYYRPRRALTARDRAMTRLRLRTLAHMVKFHRCSDMAPFTGTCYTTNRRSMCHPLETGDLRGVVEAITYDDGIFERVRGQSSGANKLLPYEFDELQFTYFGFAVPLVHELAHAAVCVRLRDSEQMVTRWRKTALTGKPIVFGGPIFGDSVAEWPSPYYAKLYLEYDSQFWMRASDLGDVETRWEYDPYTISLMFHDYLWDFTVASGGIAQLRVAKIRGFRVKQVHGEQWHEFIPDDKDAERFDGVPEGFRADGALILPLEGDVDIDLDISAY